MGIFIGRSSEIDLFRTQLRMESSRIVVINGRRRIGKSTLAEKIAEGYNFFSFSGLAPEQCLETDKSKDQLRHFIGQLGEKTKKNYDPCSSWLDALYLLAREIPDNEKTIVLFDEISWMGMDDRNFVGKLKVWWDTKIAHGKNVLLIFCGSVSTWIEKNIINSTAFYGRISSIIQLKQLSLLESVTLLKARGLRCSAYEYLRILSITGGVPWYLEQFDPKKSIDRNIVELCFDPSGILNFEFEKIFNDVFSRYGNIYRKILTTLSKGVRTLAQIREDVGYLHGGGLSVLMDNLSVCGFVSKHPLWSFKTKKLSNLSLYRICDPYIRFYLKYILPNKGKGEGLPEGFDSMIGLQMENLLQQDRKTILSVLGIEKPLLQGPYLQRKTIVKKGCQIDYLIQTNNNMLYLCEIKFRRGMVGMDVVQEVQEKIKRLSVPKGMAIVPVLFSLGNVSESVYESNFFYKIIDLCNLLEE